MAGQVLSSCKAEVKIKLPELNVTAHIFVQSHITSQNNNYNITFGRDLLREPGIDLDFQNIFIGWKETKIPIKIS